MRKVLFILLIASMGLHTQNQSVFNEEMAIKLAQLPLKSINREFPNKPGHVYNNPTEVNLSPSQLHPVFYGSFDWHSSVHGHWMLLRVLRTFPESKITSEIVQVLDNSFQLEKMKVEAEYFSKYENARIFERTYGWAWLLKLDNELMECKHPKVREWHNNLQPLTEVIVDLWKTYLPKQTYPDRTGVHPNSAFALNFALEWARNKNDREFENALIKKALKFYGNEVNTPAYLEPNGADFFSPSLQIASLMSKIYSEKEFAKWYDKFLTKKSFANLCKIPVVSDLSDYQTVHLVGLSFSRAWCMKDIATALPKNNKKRNILNNTADKLINNALPLLFAGNYGGDHWLASFALMALQSPTSQDEANYKIDNK
ncbi:MAG TPA: DUF2891 domain-containing protein [Bacteroidales bacterium]|nr:DUF2891 domain-containing protein [Bacteroidales bacterium]